ncbi:MAG: efflux RND transporter periplasmic adaptor subunit [Cytophagales bacterium]|jgi:cobalt-zinc-cadmium efflux system membrane fusion protein|nr:efflux RND transporter periplasmic adaptor subunit [Cytophagales bacterium]MCA6366287.1 efflux RND transporter periplasmic adaptor subunit [Cytophagales bacterium]MCA6371970.1 efflux RND transporter periplasmic adaptor subunit [Cytophagales bacterium]MCA6376678.1 efflux RND transporter periplasmic adaptor subunit [Cytophagales bacterium]MCA6383718.1 efflux RND transporter periplasmic adaptor subunit [Cytophagales bacterium]
MKNRIRLLLLLTVFWAACSKKDKSTETTTAQPTEIAHVRLSQEQQKLLGIVLGQPILRSMNGTLKANGMLDVPPQNMVTVSAPLGGFVKSTELLQGMKVKKGQTVIVLQHPDYIQLQEDYLTSKNQLEFLDLEYKRQEELAKENVTAAKALQQAKSNYFGTKAKVQGLRAKLKLININPQELENGEIQNTISIPSPISGFVTEVNVNIGMHVNPTDVLFKIIDTEHLHAEAQVFEKDVPRLKIGQQVRVYLSNENKERLAKVFLIGKEITAERTVRVHCHLEGEDPSLIPGLYFKALIETDPQQVTTLPNEAVVDFENKQYVFVEQKAGVLEYEMIEISKLKSEEDFTEVALPSSIAGRKIVLKGTYALLSILKNTEE